MAATEKQKLNLKPARKGEIRNPKGKAKGILNSKTVITRWLGALSQELNPITGKNENLTQLDQLILAQIKEAKNGNTRALAELLDRVEGKAKQSMEMTGKDGGAISINLFPSQGCDPLNDD